MPAWQPLATTGAPEGRDRHAAGALGTKYIATGGTTTFNSGALATSVSYDLATDTWGTYGSHVAARCSHSMVSTGTKLYTFGGLTDCSNGAAIGPGLEESSGGAWSTVTAANAPKGRYNFAMGWPGTEVMVYGGGDDTAPAVSTGSRLVPGAAWTDAACALTGCERGGFYALFLDGNVMHVVGGGPFGDAPNGLEYNLATNTWSAWAVPTGGPALSELTETHGDDGRHLYFMQEPATCTDAPSLLIYDRKSKTWSKDTSAPPTGLLARGATAWVGSELVVWSGNCGSGNSTVGGRYQPAAPAP